MNEVKEVKAFVIPVVDAGNGDIALEFPDELIELLNLNINDELLFIEEDNSWKLFKKTNNL